MAVNSEGVVDNGLGSEKLVLAEEGKVVIERLDGGMKDMDGEDAFEDAIEGGECRGCVEEEKRMAENGGGMMEEATQVPLQSESFEEALEHPSQEGNGDAGTSDHCGPSTVSLVEDVRESGIGGGGQYATEFGERGASVVEDGEMDRRSDALDVIRKQEENGSVLYSSDINGETNNVPVSSELENTQCGKDAAVQEKFQGGINNYMQICSNGICKPDPDIVGQKKDATGQLPEEVFATIGKNNLSGTPISDPDIDDKERDTSLFHENASSGTGKRDLVVLSVGDIESTENEHANGTLEEEEEEEKEEVVEEETSLMSVGDMDTQFDSPDEVEGSHTVEEEEFTFNETEDFPRDHEEATSDISSEEELMPSTQLKSIEELLHKHVVQSTIITDKSSATTLTSSSAKSSIDLPVLPSCPAGLGSSLSLKKEKDKVRESPLHEDSQSERYCNSTSSKHVEKQTSQPLKLDESTEAEAREKKSVATDKLGTKSMGVLSTGSSSDSLPLPHHARLGSPVSLLQPASHSQQQARANGTVAPTRSLVTEEGTDRETDEDSETREKLQMIRVKFLRLSHRLGQTPHNPVVAQVLYRLGLAEQLQGSRARAFSFDSASALAEQLEAAGQDALDFSCTIMVLGKTGVGKSATINSIFDETKFSTDAFQMGTKKVQAVVGTVEGIQVKVIDTPGLLSSFLDQRHNKKILNAVKSFIKRTPPDIVLYLDRLDMQSRDYGDLPLLRTITDIFGPASWFNAIIVLTHAASAPPEGPSGALSYETFVSQRSHVVQQAIRQAAGDMRLMNPVSLVENHSACRTNRAGQRVLPNGQVWKPQLLLLSFASKILSEANALLKLQTNTPGKPFGVRSRVPPLPFFLSSLLQSRPQVKLPEEQFGDEDGTHEDLDESSDSDDECEYDELPPFKPLNKQQLSKLSKEQQRAYFDELDYREKLFMKKQLKEEKKRRKLLKKMAGSGKQRPQVYNENMEEEGGGSGTVPVLLPDMALPSSFDSENPTYRYRYLDTPNQWFVRPVFEAHGWDHDVGYEGLNVERLFVVKEKIPISISGQVTKDKRESNLQLECVTSIKHGEGKATSVSFDMQSVGKDIAYTLLSETRFSNYRCNKAAAGLSVTLLGDALSAGLKLEDQLMIHKRFKVVMTGGAMAGRGDVAYGGSLEATLRDKEYPIGQTLSTLGLSVMDWHGDLAIGCNLQSQFPVGRGTNMIARANLNNRGAGQVSIKLSSSERFQIALFGLLPLLRHIINNRLNSQSMQ